MSEPFLAQITMFGSNFAPRGWALCDGQLLPINQNQSLYSLLGTTYGGDGRTNFALPDLRGRTPIHPGDGPNLTPRNRGDKGGTETVAPKTAKAAGPHKVHVHDEKKPKPEIKDAPTLEVAGTQAQDQNAMQPFLAVNYIIALQGVFPSRN